MLADLPVGENMQDHVMVDAVAATVNDGESMSFKSLNSLMELLKQKVTGKCRFHHFIYVFQKYETHVRFSN